MKKNSLQYHIRMVKEGKRRLVMRSDFWKHYQKTYAPESTSSQPDHKIVGREEEIEKFVEYIRKIAEGNHGENGASIRLQIPNALSGKSDLVNKIVLQQYQKAYFEFLNLPGNEKFTFRFVNLDRFGFESATINLPFSEDAVMLILTVYDDPDENKNFLIDRFGFSPASVEKLYSKTRKDKIGRPYLDPTVHHLWGKIREYADNNFDKMAEFIEVIPWPLPAEFENDS